MRNFSWGELRDGVPCPDTHFPLCYHHGSGMKWLERFLIPVCVLTVALGHYWEEGKSLCHGHPLSHLQYLPNKGQCEHGDPGLHHVQAPGRGLRRRQPQGGVVCAGWQVERCLRCTPNSGAMALRAPIPSLLRHILGGPGPSLFLTHISTLVFSGRTASGQTGIPRLFSVLDTNGSGGAPEPAAMKTRHWPPDQSLGALLCLFRGPVLARFSTLLSVLW